MQKNIKNWLARFSLLIKIGFWFYFSVLTWLLLKPSTELKLIATIYNDKSVHILTFCLLTLLGIFSFPKIKPFTWVIIFFCYGVMIEFLQESMNMGRTFEYSDMLADLTGCFLGFLIWKLIK